MRRRTEKGRPPAPGRRRRLLIVLAIVGVLAAALVATVAARGPLFFMSCDPEELAAHPASRTSYVYGSDGSLLATIATDEQRQPVPLDAVSPWLRHATVAIEDRRFYDHEGVDYRGLFRALFRNVERGAAVEGGSTITQQLARTLYLDQERTVSRKLAEACLAVEIERRWEKDRILATYLNRVYFGNRAYGAAAAARTYFSKPAAELTMVEAALLAGLPQAPSQLNPLDRPEAALARRNDVLAALAAAGHISEAELAEAREADLGLQPSPHFGAQRDEYLATYVEERLAEVYGREAVRRGGFRVRTTIDGRLQRAAREAIVRTLDRGDDPAAAVVGIDPETGAVRTMVAVVPGQESVSFNFAADGRRQAGSTFKTFALTEAVGRGINPWGTEYLSAPFAGPESEGEPWQVTTYDESYTGRTSLAGATVRSDNTVYARLIVDLGPEQVLETARRMGIESELPPVPSIVLGSGEVSPLEMTAAYATLASGGERREPVLIERVIRPDGTEEPGPGWEQAQGEGERALPAGVAYHVTRVLQRSVEAGTGTAAQIGRPVAGKTGTTDDYTDAWFSGYTPHLAATVWVGYPDSTAPMRDVHGISVSGGTFPAAIWARFMAPAHDGVPAVDFADPGEPIAWERFCGRVQFARGMADARPEARCPEPERQAGGPRATGTAEEEDEDERRRPRPPARTQDEDEEERERTPTQPPATQPPPTTTAAQPPARPPGQGRGQLVGRRGIVVVDIPADDYAPPPELGEVEIEGRSHLARSEDGYEIMAGTEVEVTAVEGNRLVVRVVPGGG